jgi:hypothetical protein
MSDQRTTQQANEQQQRQQQAEEEAARRMELSLFLAQLDRERHHDREGRSIDQLPRRTD